MKLDYKSNLLKRPILYKIFTIICIYYCIMGRLAKLEYMISKDITRFLLQEGKLNKKTVLRIAPLTSQ